MSQLQLEDSGEELGGDMALMSEPHITPLGNDGHHVATPSVPHAPPAPPDAPPKEGGEPELGDLIKMVRWTQDKIRAGFQTDGKLDLKAVMAARRKLLDDYRSKYNDRVVVLTDWDGYGLPDLDDTSRRELLRAGVREIDLTGEPNGENGRDLTVFDVYERCALRHTLVLARPTRPIAIQYVTKRIKAESAAELARDGKLTAELRRTLYPVDATDDGDNEILASLAYPSFEAAEQILIRFPFLSEPLRKHMERLAYTSLLNVTPIPPNQQRKAIENLLSAERIASLGGWKNFIACDLAEIGRVVIRRPSRVEIKKYEQARAVKGAEALFELGENLLIHPETGTKFTDYPGLAYVLGFAALQAAAGAIEEEIKK